MNRDLKIDGLKFIMIFCVVLGHLKFNDYGIHISKMLFSFHMPVFVFLSGYLTSLSPDWGKRWMWIKQTLCIYAVAQVLHIILGLCLHHQLSLHFYQHLSIKDLICPEYTLWYLICLVYWRISVWTVFRSMDDILLLALSLMLAIISGFVPLDYEFSFQRAFAFFPVFVLGLLFKKHDGLSFLEKVPSVIALFLLVAGLLVARQLPAYLPAIHYTDSHDLVLRCLQTLMGIVLCLCIIRLSRFGFTERFAEYGKYTLWIYLGHSYLTRINVIERFLHHYFGIERTIWGALIICTFYCILFIMAARLFYSTKNRRLQSI